MFLFLGIHVTDEVAGSIRLSPNGFLVAARGVGLKNSHIGRVVHSAKFGTFLIDRQSIQ